MSYPYYDDVVRAHSELQAEGLIKTRTDQAQVEEDKGAVVRRAAFYAYQKDPTHGLLAKTSGNQSMGYSVDWILRSTDGEGWDVVTDDGTQALPLNGGPVGADPARIPDWRQPTAELAQIDDEFEPDPPPVEQNDLDDIYAALEALQTQQAQDTQLVMAHMDANTKQILDTIDSIKTQVEESLQKALAIIIHRKRDEPEPVP